jgi:hypothetical protein
VVLAAMIASLFSTVEQPHLQSSRILIIIKITTSLSWALLFRQVMIRLTHSSLPSTNPILPISMPMWSRLVTWPATVTMVFLAPSLVAHLHPAITLPSTAPMPSMIPSVRPSATAAPMVSVPKLAAHSPDTTTVVTPWVPALALPPVPSPKLIHPIGTVFTELLTIPNATI